MVVVEVTNTELAMGLEELVAEVVVHLMPPVVGVQLIMVQMVSLVLEVEMVVQIQVVALVETNTVQEILAMGTVVLVA